MTDWQARMSDDMRLRDYRPRTQEAYLLAARLLARHFGRAPDTLTEDDIRAYFLYLREQRKLAPSTLKTLRHRYATHLLEAGITLRTIQMVLGHKTLRATEVYMHVTQPATERLQHTLDRLMADI